MISSAHLGKGVQHATQAGFLLHRNQTDCLNEGHDPGGERERKRYVELGLLPINAPSHLVVYLGWETPAFIMGTASGKARERNASQLNGAIWSFVRERQANSPQRTIATVPLG